MAKRNQGFALAFLYNFFARFFFGFFGSINAVTVGSDHCAGIRADKLWRTAGVVDHQGAFGVGSVGVDDFEAAGRNKECNTCWDKY